MPNWSRLSTGWRDNNKPSIWLSDSVCVRAHVCTCSTALSILSLWPVADKPGPLSHFFSSCFLHRFKGKRTQEQIRCLFMFLWLASHLPASPLYKMNAVWTSSGELLYFYFFLCHSIFHAAHLFHTSFMYNTSLHCWSLTTLKHTAVVRWECSDISMFLTLSLHYFFFFLDELLVLNTIRVLLRWP